MFLVQYTYHLFPLNLQRSASRNGRGRRQTQARQCRQRLFSNEVTR